VLWATLPLTVGPAVEDALGGLSDPVRWTAAVGLWVTWAGVLLALLVPRVVSLTALRVGAPAVPAVAVAAAIVGDVAAVDLLAVAVGAGVVVVAAWPTIGEALVDGSSYGPERRFPLRVPPAVGAVAGPVAVVMVLTGVAVGPLLLAAQQWLLGAAVTVVGLAAAAVGARSLHGLSRRFLVMVPGGVVVHDPLTLTDPVLLAKAALASVGPAPADTDATDLTLGAGGLVLELRLRQPAELARRSRRDAEAVRTAGVLVSPTRPGALLEDARARGLPVG
jgi:hypothetical protein